VLSPCAAHAEFALFSSSPFPPWDGLRVFKGRDGVDRRANGAYHCASSGEALLKLLRPLRHHEGMRVQDRSFLGELICHVIPHFVEDLHQIIPHDRICGVRLHLTDHDVHGSQLIDAPPYLPPHSCMHA
jgi:hypothetical protein